MYFFLRDEALLDLGKLCASPQGKKQAACRNVMKITKTKSKLSSTDCRSFPKGLKVFGISSLTMMMAGDFMECSNRKNIVYDVAENEGKDSTYGTVVDTRRRRIKKLICLVHAAESYSKHEYSCISEELENNSYQRTRVITQVTISVKWNTKSMKSIMGEKHWTRHDEMVTSNEDGSNMEENLIWMIRLTSIVIPVNISPL